jgi:hypothetical protein
MAKKLSRLIALYISAEAGKGPPVAGATSPDGWTKVGRIKSYSDSYATTEIDDSDYDDGADDSARPGTRQGKLTLGLNYDQNDSGQRILAAMNKASNGGIIGSVLIRTENDNGQEEFASDCFVTQFDHGAASRQDMQGKSCNIRLTGARRESTVQVVLP